MNKVRRYFEEHRFLFGFFFLILIAQYIGNYESVCKPHDAIYTYHIVDFRFGLVSKVIQGQLFQLFFPDVTIQEIKTVSLVIFALVALCAGYFLEDIYNSAKQENKPIILFLIIIFCISGCTFNMFYRQLGMLDVYWIYAFVFFLIFMKSRKTWFLIPLPFVFMIAVHYGCLISYVPLMSIIILYKAATAKEQGDKKYLLGVFFASVILAFCAFVFFTYNEKHHLNYTIEELHRYFDSRGTDFYTYYEYAYFKDFSILFPDGTVINVEDIKLIDSPLIPTFIRSLINDVVWRLNIVFLMMKKIPIIFKDTVPTVVITVLAMTPMLIHIYGYFRRIFKSAENKLIKFCMFCAMALYPFTFISSLFYSFDTTRWLSHAFICCFVCFFAVLRSDGEEHYIPSVRRFGRMENLVFMMYAVLNFLARFDPYR